MATNRSAPLLILSLILAGLTLPAFSRNQNPPPAGAKAQTEQSALPEGAVQYASLNSPSLGRELRYAVQLPPSYSHDSKRRYPVVYFLHGMNGSERDFESRGVAAAISRLRTEGKTGEFITVAPAGQNSFYVNAKNGLQYEDAIVKDLVEHVEKTYRAMLGPRNRAIQGISMGGFGAMLIAFKHPQLFSSMTAHCSAVVAEIPKPTGTSRRDMFLLSLIGKLFGDPPDEVYFKANNPMSLAESNAASIKKTPLKIYFDVGDQDRYGFTEPNKALDQLMTKDGLVHEFHVFPGGHGWDYMLSVADHSYGFLWKVFESNGGKK